MCGRVVVGGSEVRKTSAPVASSEPERLDQLRATHYTFVFNPTLENVRHAQGQWRWRV